jgi:hypothetical protein
MPTTAELKAKPVEAVEPPMPMEMPVPVPKKKVSRWVWVIIITILVILLVCVVPLIIIDATNSWCPLFGDIINSFRAGACLP